MSGRMGTAADAVFGPNAFASIFGAVDRGAGSGGLAGSVESDAKGEYRVVTGAGVAEVGLYFSAEGTEAEDWMVSEVRSACGEGILVVLDPDLCEVAVYRVDAQGHGLASALQAERSHPDGVTVAHVGLGGPLALHQLAHYAVEEEQRRVLEDRAQRGLPLDVRAYRDVHDE